MGKKYIIVITYFVIMNVIVIKLLDLSRYGVFMLI